MIPPFSSYKEKVISWGASYFNKESFHHHSFRYFRDILIVALVVTIGILLFKADAATFTFIQTGWQGGASNLTANHASDRSNWTKYESATGITAASTVSLSFTSASVVDGVNGLVPLSPASIAAGTHPNILTVSPDGTSVYATNYTDNTVSMYSRNTTTGALTALGTPTIGTGSNPAGIVISPDGTSVYVANYGAGTGNTVSMYSRNTTTGALTALGTPTIAAGSGAYFLTVSPDGTSVYATNYTDNTVSMYSRNTTTGALTALGTPTIAAGTRPYGMTISPDGASVYVANYNDSSISMYSRNTTTGALTALGTPTIAAGSSPANLVVSSDGTSVYVANYGSGNVSMYSRNTTTGALTALGTPTIAAGSGAYSIAISPDGASVHVANYTSNTISMYSRNTTTGALTALATPTIAAGTGPNAITISPDGASVYVANYNGSTVSMFRRSVSGGAKGFEQGTHSSTMLSGSVIKIADGGSLTALGTPTIAAGSTPYGVVISPDGTSVYVINNGNNSGNTLSMYSRNTTTGALTSLGTIGSETGPQGIAISPDGTSVYVANHMVSSVSMYSRNTTTGVLASLGTIGSGSNPSDITVSPDGASVYVANFGGSSVSMYSRNTSTGALTALATPTIATAGQPYGLIVSPDGTSVYVGDYTSSSVSMYSRNITTGALTSLGTIAAGTNPYRLIISSDGASVYVTNYTSNTVSLYSRNTSTGALTALGTPTIGTGSNPGGIAISPNDASVYVANYTSNTVSLYSRNTSTGALTALATPTIAAGTGPIRLTVSPDGASVYAANYGSNNVSMYSRSSGVTSGTFTSAVVDMGSGTSFSTVSYAATTTAGQSVTIDVRAGNTATPDGTWSGWVTGLTSGSSISSLSGRYVQYRLNLTSSNTSSSPTVSSVTLSYSSYPSSGTLVSSPFDSSSSGNILASIAWNATTPSDTTVKFQLRSAPDASGAPGSWTGWMGPDGTANSFFTLSNGSETLPTALRDGTSDQWFQYKMILSQTNGTTPTVSSVTVTYVVNAPPSFDETFGTGGVLVEQVASSTDPNYGKVRIQYRIRDPDSATGSVTPGFVTPSFEYNIGSGWTSVPTESLSASATENKSVSEAVYTTYEAYLDLKSLVPETYTENARIRVTINDNEGANNISNATSSVFIVDTKNPVLASMHIDGTSATNTVSFVATDNLPIRSYILSNNSDFTPDNENASSGIAQAVGTTSVSLHTSWVLTGTSSKTVYLKVEDERGNITTSSVVVPQTPLNMEYRDLSSIDTGTYRLFVAWSLYPSPPPAGAPFSSYKLYRSTDGLDFSLAHTSTNPSINYYLDTAVATTTTYYYKVAFVTANGDTTIFSPTVSDTPDGKGGSGNGAVPLITNVAIVDVKNTSAKVTWTTDELALSEVDFGTTQSYGRVASNRSYVQDHAVYLTGLVPNTQYYVRVRSIDVFSGTATKDNGGTGYTFTTGGGPVISNVVVSSISDTSADIVWNTSASSDSYVYYSTSPTLDTYTQVGSDMLVEAPFQHKVTLTGLRTDTMYYFKVSSKDADGNTTEDANRDSYYAFRTTYDTKAPVITDVTVPVKASNGAVITWKTDELSTSKVEYGTATGTPYAFATTDIITPTIFHSVTLSEETTRLGGGTNVLQKKTTYYYRVKSTDQAGNSSYSDEGSFTTSEDGAVVLLGGSTVMSDGSKADTTRPVISDFKITNVNPFGATISFTTDEDTRAIAQYGNTTNYDGSVGTPGFAQSHTLPLRGLRMGTEYHVSASVVDRAGNVSSSPDQTFKTTNIAENLGNLLNVNDGFDTIQEKIEDLIESALPSINPPFIENPVADSIGEDFATITWRTNVRSYGTVLYAEDAEYIRTGGQYTSELTKTDEKKTEHSFDLSSLKPNTKYHYKVRSYVFLGAPGESQDKTFTTKASGVQVQIVDRKKDSLRVVWTTPEPTTSVVSYKKRGEQFAIRKTDDSLTTNHDIKVDNLAPATVYELRVFGVTQGGNTIEAKNTITISTNQDTAAPIITNFKVDTALVPGRTDRTQTIVSWKTDEPATSAVYYEEGSGSSLSALTNKKENLDTYTDNHVVILTSLKPGTIYRFQIVSTDDANNTTRMPVRTIVTPNQSESVVDIIFKNFDDTFKFLRNVQ